MHRPPPPPQNTFIKLALQLLKTHKRKYIPSPITSRTQGHNNSSIRLTRPFNVTYNPASKISLHTPLSPQQNNTHNLKTMPYDFSYLDTPTPITAPKITKHTTPNATYKTHTSLDPVTDTLRISVTDYKEHNHTKVTDPIYNTATFSTKNTDFQIDYNIYPPDPRILITAITTTAKNTTPMSQTTQNTTDTPDTTEQTTETTPPMSQKLRTLDTEKLIQKCLNLQNQNRDHQNTIKQHKTTIKNQTTTHKKQLASLLDEKNKNRDLWIREKLKHDHLKKTHQKTLNRQTFIAILISLTLIIKITLDILQP